MKESQYIINQAKNRAGKREKEVKGYAQNDELYHKNYDQINWDSKKNVNQ